MCTSSTSTAATVELLRKSFSTFGLPDVVVSDNAAGFTSEDFEVFLKSNGVKHVRTPPYHPSSKGLVERAVQTLKRGLKKFKEGSLDTKLSRFLFSYRATPHSSTAVSPAELMFGRCLHSPLDNLRPDLGRKMHQKQQQTKSTHDKHARAREFSVNDLVYLRNYSTGAKWLPGKITETLGAAMFGVQLTDGRTVRRHADQLRSRPSGPITQTTSSDSEEDYDFDVSTQESTQENSEPSLSESVADTSSTMSANTETTRTPATTNQANESSRVHLTFRVRVLQLQRVQVCRVYDAQTEQGTLLPIMVMINLCLLLLLN